MCSCVLEDCAKGDNVIIKSFQFKGTHQIIDSVLLSLHVSTAGLLKKSYKPQNYWN